MKASEMALVPVRAHDRRAGAPTGRMTTLPTKKQVEKIKCSHLRQVTYYSLSRQTPSKMLTKEACGFGSVAIKPGYKVGIYNGNHSFTAILTTSNTTSTPGARVRSLPATADTNTRNSRLKSQKGIPVNTQKLWSLV